MAEGTDCAVRFGPLSDSNLIVRRLGHVAMVNCASPGYLAHHGTPHTPDDLVSQAHSLIGYAAAGADTSRSNTFDYCIEKEPQSLEVSCQVLVNNAESYIACCEAGLGIIQVPRYDVSAQLQEGTLVELLSAFTSEPLEISVLYPHRQNRTPRVDAFVDWFNGLMQVHLKR